MDALDSRGVKGVRWLRSRRSWVCWDRTIVVPAVRNRRALNMAWVIR